jgi:hypothetical protein
MSWVSNYGKLLGTVDLEKENIYTLFVNYFDNISLTKVKQQENLGVWMAKINSMLKKGYYYVIALVEDDDDEIGAIKNLEDVEWTCLQTKNLEEYHSLPLQGYTIKREDPFNSKIEINKRDQRFSEYTCSKYPSLKITLIHTKNIEYEFSNSGTINAAVETFNTLITFN